MRLPLGSPNRPRRRLGIGPDWEDGKRIREGIKRREFRWFRRAAAAMLFGYD
jgi:hypothetical protein